MQYGLSALERLFSTRDGWACVVALDDDRAGRLGEILGIDIRGDERFSTFESRRQHDDDLGELLEDAIAAWSTADLLKALDAEDIPAIEPSGRIIHELMNDPDLRRRRRRRRNASRSQGKRARVRPLLHRVRCGVPITPVGSGAGSRHGGGARLARIRRRGSGKAQG